MPRYVKRATKSTRDNRSNNGPRTGVLQTLSTAALLPAYFTETYPLHFIMRWNSVLWSTTARIIIIKQTDLFSYVIVYVARNYNIEVFWLFYDIWKFENNYKCPEKKYGKMPRLKLPDKIWAARVTTCVSNYSIICGHEHCICIEPAEQPNYELWVKRLFDEFLKKLYYSALCYI